MKVVQYAAPSALNSPSVIPAFDSVELHYLQYFMSRAGPDLAGVHDPEIWLRYTTHVAYNEPSIKHALLAVAAMHQQFKTMDGPSQQQTINEYALRQYVKSIRSVESVLKGSPVHYPDTLLMACMLFCAFESMSYHIGSAIMHASSGINILAQARDSERALSSLTVPPDQLLPLYIRLDTQSLELGETSSALPKGNNRSIWDAGGDETTVTDAYKQNDTPRVRVGQELTSARLASQHSEESRVARFSSIAAAQTQFDIILNGVFHSMYHIDRHSRSPSEEAETIQALADVVLRYGRWCKAFDHTVRSGVTPNDVEKRLLMQVWRLLININLQVDLGQGEMDFDRFTGEFQSLVELSICFVLIHRVHEPTSRLAVEKHPMDHGLSVPPKDQNLNVHRASMDLAGLKGGYLGIHPKHTPFVKEDSLDCASLHATTIALMEAARETIEATHPKPRACKGEFSVLFDLAPSFSLSPGIVSPVFVAISRCRDPHIRRQALHLLRKCKRREGLWDSALAARLGEMVIQIEEQRARELNLIHALAERNQSARSSTTGRAMPNEARIRMIKPTWLPDRTTVERLYFGWGDWSDAQESSIEEVWVEEVLSW